jgi:excisionase family DNA binding protein
MYKEMLPLYSLTIGEFIALTKKVVDETISERLAEELPAKKPEEEITFNISELADFLRCSKVSIHKYKKKGLPFYKIGRKILFKKSEVLNFMDSLKGKRAFYSG